MVLAAGIFLYYAGMETQAVHVKNMKNPSRDYPLVDPDRHDHDIVIFVLGTLAVGVVIPHKSINLARACWSPIAICGPPSACPGSATSWP